jgi:hypothetical protein
VPAARPPWRSSSAGSSRGSGDRAKILDDAFEVLERLPGEVPNVLPDPQTRGDAPLRPTNDVVDALEVALVRWFRDPDLETCLVRTVNLGGDADTTGALAGALAGATWGVGGIPRRWARAVSDRGVLVRLAGSLLTRSEEVGR